MLFKSIRSLICPFNIIESYVPKQGKILDLGCGHGIFSALLAQKSRNRKILGIDPSGYKIKLAQKHYYTFPNIKFKKTDLKHLKTRYFDSIVIIDVLYLLPNKEQLELLKTARSLLKKKGSLILKITNNKPAFFYYLVRLEEYIMIKILKYTYSTDQKLHFLTREESRKLLKKAGFTIQTEKTFRGILPYFHLLFVVTKTQF